MKSREVKESDATRAHRLFAKILLENELADYRRFDFARALAVQLHTMKLSPSTLLTPEGFDCVEAVAKVLNVQAWRDSKIVLPKAWLTALEFVGAGYPEPSTQTSYDHFSNRIRIR